MGASYKRKTGVYKRPGLRNTIFISKNYPENTKNDQDDILPVTDAYEFDQAYHLSAMPWRFAPSAGEDGVRKMQNRLYDRWLDTDTTVANREEEGVVSNAKRPDIVSGKHSLHRECVLGEPGEDVSTG